VLGYERETFSRETWVTATSPCKVDESGLTFRVHIEPHGEWTTDLHVVTASVSWGETRDKPKYERHNKRPRPNQERSLEKWLEDAPSLTSDWDWLKMIYTRSLVDLAALRFAPGPPAAAACRPPACRGS